MATRKTSESGAFMSKYDQEVELRLKALEAEVTSLRAELSAKESAPSTVGGDIETKFNELVRILKRTETLNIGKLSKGLL